MPTSFPGAVDSLPRPTSTTNTSDSGFELDIVVDNLSDAVEALEAEALPAVCDVYLTANATNLFTSGAAVFVPWTAEAEDTYAMHDLVTNPSRVTVPSGRGGLYLIQAQIQWDASASGNYRNLGIYRNGSQIADSSGVVQSSGDSLTLNVTLIRLAATDYVEVAGYQNSGAARTAIGGTGKTLLRVARIGA